MYSHDSVGLGHFRRTLTLADSLARTLPGASVLIATGSPCASHFDVPDRVEVLKLPSVGKDHSGAYVSRSLPCSLGAIIDLRMRLLLEARRGFRPHLVVVDHQVAGLRGEMLPVLEEARADGAVTLLGLRDIIDEPRAVARDWARPEVQRALEVGYDRICVYGWPTVFDPRVEYSLPGHVADRVEFTGYVVRPLPVPRVEPLPPDRPAVLVTVGGGEDGAGRLRTYLEGLEIRPPWWDSTLLLGPLIDPEVGRSLRRRARLIRGVTVHGFRADLPQQLVSSAAVVSMAGYNTTAEILSSGRPAVMLPRSVPRREQIIRAERLAALGLVDVLTEPTPETLRFAVERALSRTSRPAAHVRLDGARRLAAVARDLLDVPEQAPVPATVPLTA